MVAVRLMGWRLSSDLSSEIDMKGASDDDDALREDREEPRPCAVSPGHSASRLVFSAAVL